MFLRFLTVAGLSLSLSLVPHVLGPAFGHHSFAMFDQTQTFAVNGVVTRFDWANPHGWLYLETSDENGNEVAWSFETATPSGLAKTGWSPEVVVEGDRVEVGFHPLRDGTNGGQLITLVLPNGVELCSGLECRERYGVTN